MFRTAWFYVTMLFSTIYFGLTAIIAGLLRVPRKPGGVYEYCARGWSRINLKAAGIEVLTAGREAVPRTPVVFVSNHQSWFDIFALADTVPHYFSFVAKKELRKVPILGRAMESAGQIFVDRQNRQAAFSAYEEAAQAIRSGLSAVVFAEGTRSRTGEMLPFKKGPFVLAIAAQVPVIPVYCAGTFDILPKGGTRIKPHPIAIIYGDPIPTEGMEYDDRERLMDVTRKAIEALRDQSDKTLGRGGT